ncbi:uncharacterized protein LOC118436921 [Folsomia candida]|uniref:uncharacterized protein LOC118436921 n=1 Tax=Folsomia candida TaxID=158441 RepID=UPI001604EEFF|nr:uncharacterized protein LOC118436921 [Folsomia candida]XP_035711488.1 uncharacterized protein LOC118436921 [Folsomia candida]XP_035711489.1 uncharacterized protein LOC118436921 [Folsomia candida]XP_035711490.1 uncharacterized protein LOC118436921 [Folsomia candida]
MAHGFVDSQNFDGIYSIQFSRDNLIRVNGVPTVPKRLIDCVRKAITSGWVKGLFNESVEHGAHEFCLVGAPWFGKQSNGVAGRRLLASILLELARQGWQFLQSFDPTRKDNDKDTMFFEFAKPDQEAEIFVVSFNRTSRIRLIEPPNSQVVDAFKTVVTNGWGRGIFGHRTYYGADEITLVGTPWLTSNKSESIAAKQLVAYLIYGMKRIGYKIYASVDITGRMAGNHTRDTGNLDVLVFRKISETWGN